jgi:energy-coupling factor transporter ATP-binding protein EcfA2
MKLVSAHITNFRSIEDSNKFEIGELTCLVGKNESGKTAILQAFYGINPLSSFVYDRTRDYPRRHLNRFDDRHPEGKSKVIETRWSLSPADIKLVSDIYGSDALENTEITISTYIGTNGQHWSIPCDERACLDHLINELDLDEAEKNFLKNAQTGKQALSILNGLSQRSDKLEELLADLNQLKDGSFSWEMIKILSQNMPDFFYTSHFDRMSGEISINKIETDIKQKTVTPSDQIFLDFLEYAGTSIDELKGASKYEDLKARCEGASNEITDEIFQFWSQNDALKVVIDIAEGKVGDEPPFNFGTIVKIRIENTNHRVTVPLSERSAGFVWFFSFLSQFKQLKKTAGNAIILLDEPGLTLHGKAQSDLLRYIEERLLPEHQVIFTTHSPFMVPAERMADVRIVEDVIKYESRKKPTVLGTKISSDALSVDKDTLFPLQAALGYEITQSLFIGKNTLLVEGPSDILYLQAFSTALKNRKREGLDSRWTICPSGGIDKISPFASLFGANNLNIAVLCDLASGDKSKIEKLRKSQVLKANQLFTAADFTGKSESDIEDFLHPELFVRLLNKAYSLSKKNSLSVAKLDAELSTERIVKKAEAAFRTMPQDVQEFDHFYPSDWLIRNPAFLVDSPELEETLDRFEEAFKAINAVAI